MRALVIGGTGLVGSYLVKELIASEIHTFVTLLVRKKQLQAHPKINEIIFDFKDQSDIPFFDKVDQVFCCIGTTIKKAGSRKNFMDVDYGIPIRFAYWSERMRVRSFSIITSMGANESSMFFYNKVKGKVENEIKKVSIPKINIFRPALILGERLDKRPGEKLGQVIFRLINPILIGYARRYRAIEARQIARGMLYHLETTDQGVHIIESNLI
tara:strand:+ start:2035 stop:2673 length:639 start_codon:yes stop_codon:yes gene_type:complete